MLRQRSLELGPRCPSWMIGVMSIWWCNFRGLLSSQDTWAQLVNASLVSVDRWTGFAECLPCSHCHETLGTYGIRPPGVQIPALLLASLEILSKWWSLSEPWFFISRRRRDHTAQGPWGAQDVVAPSLHPSLWLDACSLQRPNFFIITRPPPGFRERPTYSQLLPSGSSWWIKRRTI